MTSMAREARLQREISIEGVDAQDVLSGLKENMTLLNNELQNGSVLYQLADAGWFSSPNEQGKAHIHVEFSHRHWRQTS